MQGSESEVGAKNPNSSRFLLLLLLLLLLPLLPPREDRYRGAHEGRGEETGETAGYSIPFALGDARGKSLCPGTGRRAYQEADTHRSPTPPNLPRNHFHFAEGRGREKGNRRLGKSFLSSSPSSRKRILLLFSTSQKISFLVAYFFSFRKRSENLDETDSIFKSSFGIFICLIARIGIFYVFYFGARGERDSPERGGSKGQVDDSKRRASEN